MHRCGAMWCLAAALCATLLLCDHPAAAARPGVVLSNATPLDGSEVVVSTARLRRVRRNSQYKGSLVQLTQLLEQQADLSIDGQHDRLFFACSGLALPVSVAAAEAAAVAAASAAFDAAVAAGEDATAHATFLQPSISTEVPIDDPIVVGGGRHHHHHRHRHLLQTGNGELTTSWLPDMLDLPTTNITKDQAFALHSRPGATRKIYLDFDGHTATGTAWNNMCGLSSIVTPPFDTDGNGTNWTPSELLSVLATWRQVSEDFAPFDVDVTTEEPSAAVLSSSGIRVALGGNGAWYSTCQGTNATFGGVAYMNAFGGGTYYTPAYVWPVNHGNRAKYMAEATSHECGHTLGLYHDGFKNATTGATNKEYSNGVAEWGPLMGAPYASALTQWSRGEYLNANNMQDDTTIIRQYLPSIVDAYGSTAQTATPISGDFNASGYATAIVTGVIRDPSDVDAMAFTASPGTATVQVLLVPKWGSAGRANLNVSLSLKDASQNTLATRAGVGIGTFNVQLPAAGTYYLQLSSTGVGDPVNPPGYSMYGSLGQYEVVLTYFAGAAAVCATPPQNPGNGTFSCPSSTYINKPCVATCNPGFLGSPTITCLADGTWSQPAGTCYPVCSGNPANPPNSTFSCTNNSLSGTVCVATCAAGYSGSPASTCIDGQWSAANSTCLRVCSTKPSVSNGVFSCPATSTQGTVCTAACNNLYTGAPNATCLDTGSWSAVTGSCLRLCTSKPANVTNGDWGSCAVPNVQGNMCTAQCLKGFTGAPNATCTSTGSWSSTTGSCVRVCDTPPPNPASGTFSCSTTSLVNSVCTATCDPGFLGSPKVTCQSNGSWTQVVGVCTKTCPTPPANPDNGVFNCSTSSLAGSTCVATCAANFTGLPVTPRTTCQTSGNWNATTGACIRVCNGNPTIGNGTFKCSANSLVGTVCNATCNTGYIGSPSVTCQDNSAWSAVQGTCDRACTSNPANPSNGVYKCTPTLVGASCIASCSQNYSGSLGPNSPSTTCLSTGSWSSTNGTCARMCLTNPTNPANGAYACSNTSIQGTVCRATCSAGFLGSPQTTCGSTGAWGSTTGSCLAVCSMAPANPANGAFNCSSTTTAGTTCAGACNIGYTGAPKVTCGTNGTWGPLSGSCIAVCSTPPANPSNGAFNCSSTTTAGTTCAGACNIGYTGAPKVTCGTNGTWGPLSGSCIAVCSTPPANPSNGTFNCSSTITAGGTCTGTCLSGFVGTPKVTCQTNGTWSPPTGSCAAACTAQPAAVGNATFACSTSSLVGAKCTATCIRGFKAGPSGAPATTCLASNTWGSPTGSCVPVVCTTAPANGTPAGATWPSLCANSAVNGTCTASCSTNSTTPPTAACLLAAAGTSASWNTTGSCA